MIRAALSLSLCTKRANSGCAMLIGSASTLRQLVAQIRRSQGARSVVRKLLYYSGRSAGGDPDSVPNAVVEAGDAGLRDGRKPPVVKASASLWSRRGARSFPARISGRASGMGAIMYAMRPATCWRSRLRRVARSLRARVRPYTRLQIEFLYAHVVASAYASRAKLQFTSFDWPTQQALPQC